MLNRIVLMGRLTRDPELRRTQSGTAVVSFSIACDRDYAAQGPTMLIIIPSSISFSYFVNFFNVSTFLLPFVFIYMIFYHTTLNIVNYL